MKKMRKIIYVGMFFALSIGGIFASDKRIKAAVLSTDKAAEKIVDASNKAYITKKNRTVTVTIRTKSKDTAYAETKELEKSGKVKVWDGIS